MLSAQTLPKDEHDVYPNTLGSFRTLILTPWSPNDLERKVDSDMPGNRRGEYTVRVSTCSWKSLDDLDPYQ